jgi:hypothetical protein
MSQFNELRLTPKLVEDFAAYIREALNPDPELRDDFYTFQLDHRTRRVFLESGTRKTATHSLFRITLRVDALDDLSFQSLKAKHIVRIDVLRNPVRTARNKALNELWSALQSAQKSVVTEPEILSLTGLPAESIDLMATDPHGPEVFISTNGVRCVRAPELLQFFDYIGQRPSKAVRP